MLACDEQLGGTERRGEAGRVSVQAGDAAGPPACGRRWNCLASRRRCSRSGLGGNDEITRDHLPGRSTRPRWSSSGGGVVAVRPGSSGVGVSPGLRTRRGPGRAPGPYNDNYRASAAAAALAPRQFVPQGDPSVKTAT